VPVLRECRAKDAEAIDLIEEALSKV
jgi:hypothetical protein